MEPWHKIATPRKEVREGRSFNPDEFAIHLEQVVSGTAPEDYRDPVQFFARTCFTRALGDHVGMVLRRLCGETANTAPVMTLVTQFGGGKTHTLAALYHLVNGGSKAALYPGVAELLKSARLDAVPTARVATFVGNAWDPAEGRETPWIDVARQLGGDRGVQELGPAARTVPPGTEALQRVFQLAGAPVLLLFDEVLNFMNRHRDMADQFHAFLQNLTVAATGATRAAALISLPRSQVEMTDWDMQWQEKISKVVRRVAKDLIANDETEIGDVVRRRLFDEIGNGKKVRNVATAYADWCFERRAQLPPEWTAVDTVTSESKAREYLRSRFEACYPFHPATLSVFQRKWQALTQYQQTRGTLAMLAQWISHAYKEGYEHARSEALITLGSAPLEAPEFRSVVLGQLGETRLLAAIDYDICGTHSHARALDADTKGPLLDIHRRVAKAIFFESSGGQLNKVAHLPELRFALGGPEVDATSIDTAASTLEDKSYFMRRVSSDGFKISHQSTLKKVVNDRRASLDEESETRPAMKKLVEDEFRRGASIPLMLFPADDSAIPDTPKLTLVVMEPAHEWTGSGSLREQIAEWTRLRSRSPRLYPAALVWCLKKPGRDLRDKVEMWLAWRRVETEVLDGSLGSEVDKAESTDIRARVNSSREAARDEVWGGYRYAVIADATEPDGLKVIDLGAGHSSAGETLCGRVITALKSRALLSETVGAGYIERNWPPAFKESGAWPLAGLRQSFLNGSLTRLIDPDTVVQASTAQFVQRGDFGLGSGQIATGQYNRVWFNEPVGIEEVSFEPNVFLITRAKAQSVKAPQSQPAQVISLEPLTQPAQPAIATQAPLPPEAPASPKTRTLRLSGSVPPEVWNRLGTRILPKLRSGADLKIGIEFSVTVDGELAKSFESDLRQALADLDLADKVKLE